MIEEVNTTDLVLHVGDLAYANGDHQIWEAFMDSIEPISRQVPYMVAIGNHGEGCGTTPGVGRWRSVRPASPPCRAYLCTAPGLQSQAGAAGWGCAGGSGLGVGVPSTSGMCTHGLSCWRRPGWTGLACVQSMTIGRGATTTRRERRPGTTRGGATMRTTAVRARSP